MSSSGSPDMVNGMGKYYPKMLCIMAIAALSIFGAKLKIALIGVRIPRKTANLIL